ncbi:unnamed protein product [Adineta steineri]|uniref:RRM domain-containing protein n=1 Tax=Adineta steineri TaxID=433720 RepID=A0A813ZPT3_9BILA|nr:unnamed protein product [Adineta steineri]CAF0950005.1 unnamed protein product [Adineta steineri]
MSQRINVSRLNPKTTEQDFERFCTRFGKVIECAIFPEFDRLNKRSGYVKFTSCYAAEKMCRHSRKETLYLDDTSIHIELDHKNNLLLHDKPKQNSNISHKKSHFTSTIYTLNIEGQITDEEELIQYLNSKPITIKFNEITNNIGQIIKTGAQVTYNDKDVVDRILKQNHKKYSIKLASNNISIKREYDCEPKINPKRSKSSENTYSSIKSHLESLTKLTRDMHEENEHLKSDKTLLTIALNQHTTRVKQIESDKSDLMESLDKTHDIAKCLTNKYKLREEEHKKSLEESNKKIVEFESIIQTTNDTLTQSINEIQRLKNQITTLENQLQALTDKYNQSESLFQDQQQDIEHFLSSLKRNF